jgi:hypothetical protein
LMQEIADGYVICLRILYQADCIERKTCKLFGPWASADSSAQFNEIMPTIYARFMEKEAREWRQIYKVSDPRSTWTDDRP